VKLATHLRWMVRESRGARGRLLYFAACLAVGVAAIVGTEALAESVDRGYRAQSRELFGADFTVDARRPLPDELDIALAGVEGLERSDSLETLTLVAAPGAEGGVGTSRLAEVFAVKGRYPLYGEVETDPPGGLARHLAPDAVVAARDLLASLGLEPGDELRVGGRLFRIAAAAKKGPGQLGFFSLVGPRVYLARDAFDGTGLLPLGTRTRHRALCALPGEVSRERLEALIRSLEASLEDAAYLDFDTHFEAAPTDRRSGRRVEGFFGLVALLSLVVGGIGVAQIVRAWIAARTPAIAVMRCIGFRPAQILGHFLGHAALLALAGSAVGALAGCALPSLVRGWAPDLVPEGAALLFPTGAVLRGIGLGVGLAAAFALPPLTAIWRVPPARVLRADAAPLPPNRVVAASAVALLGLGVFGAAWVQSGEAAVAAWFLAGFAVLVGALLLGARLLIRVAVRLPRAHLSPYLVHGVSALARPGAGTTGAVVALGLGTMVVVGTWLVETRLRDGILAQVPDDAPNVFLVDVRAGQRDGVREELARAGARGIDEVPVVMARIEAIDGRPVAELAEESERGGRALTREQRLTWREELTADNRIVAGALWSDPERFEVSVEEDYARRLGVGPGSVIEFDVQGTTVMLHVTSLRSVQWRSLAMNFFFVAEPGSIEQAPALWLASARVAPEAARALQDRLAAGHPGVTVLRVGPILEQVLAFLRRIAAGIRLLGSFTVLAGLAILAGAVSATALRRGGEVALLKTLGVTRAGAGALLFLEYGLCGALAGAVGAAGALLLAWAYFAFVGELEVSLPLLALPAAALGCGLLAALCGVAASARALAVRPNEALRAAATL